MAAWGFDYKSIITWVKPSPFGLGTYFRGSTEHVLFGVRGKLMTRSTSTATHFEAPHGAHSEKPSISTRLCAPHRIRPTAKLFSARRAPTLSTSLKRRPSTTRPTISPKATSLPVFAE
jgi:N6-adenosine-specific RNA methylase IME4